MQKVFQFAWDDNRKNALIDSPAAGTNKPLIALYHVQ